jgi:hypothetical protein
MKNYLLRTLISFVLISTPALSQTYTTLNQLGPTRQLRSQSWASSVAGLGYIWQPTQGLSYSCVTVYDNNTGSTHSNVILDAVVSSDPANILSGRQTLVYASVASVPSNDGIQFSFSIAGAGAVLVTVSGTTNTSGTFDFTEVDSFTPCQVSYSLPPQPTARNCTKVFTGTAATATQTVIASVPVFPGVGSAVPVWHVCSFSMTGPAATASSTLSINTGNSSTTCTTPSGSAYWNETTPVGIFNFSLAGAPELFQLTSSANALCFSNGGIGVTATISINYDYW